MEEKENVKKFNRTTIILIVIFILIILLVIGLFSYAYYEADIANNLTDASVTGSVECLDIGFSTSNDITLTNAKPVTDDYALTKMTPVTVTVTNNCTANNNGVNYTLALSTIYEKALSYNDKYIPDTKIRAHVKRKVGGAAEIVLKNTNFLSNISKVSTTSNPYKYITNNIINDSKYSNYAIKTMYELDSYTIPKNTSISYRVYLWVDYYEGNPDRTKSDTYDNTTENKKFDSTISITANAN